MTTLAPTENGGYLVEMGTIAFALRAQSRLRWRSWLAVVVLISIIGGFVLAPSPPDDEPMQPFRNSSLSTGLMQRCTHNDLFQQSSGYPTLRRQPPSPAP